MKHIYEMQRADGYVKIGISMTFRPMDTAPRDGTPIQVQIPGHGSDNIVFWMCGFETEDGDQCGAWAFAENQEPPECWTDGVCWADNAEGKPSVKPTAWKPVN